MTQYPHWMAQARPCEGPPPLQKKQGLVLALGLGLALALELGLALALELRLVLVLALALAGMRQCAPVLQTGPGAS